MLLCEGILFDTNKVINDSAYTVKERVLDKIYNYSFWFQPYRS